MLRSSRGEVLDKKPTPDNCVGINEHTRFSWPSEKARDSKFSIPRLILSEVWFIVWKKQGEMMESFIDYNMENIEDLAKYVFVVSEIDKGIVISGLIMEVWVCPDDIGFQPPVDHRWKIHLGKLIGCYLLGNLNELDNV